MEGWLSLAVVLDIFSRMLVGWAMDKHREAVLVKQAALMALARRHRCHLDDCSILIVAVSLPVMTTRRSWRATASR